MQGNIISAGELGTMSKNNMKGITMGIRPVTLHPLLKHSGGGLVRKPGEHQMERLLLRF